MLAADSFGVGSGPIFLDEVDCSETDSMLLQCNILTPVGIHSCTHSQDVAILCEGTVCMQYWVCCMVLHVHCIGSVEVFRINGPLVNGFLARFLLPQILMSVMSTMVDVNTIAPM